jgi:hypothetical protein
LAWSFDPQQKKTIILFERHCYATKKSEAIACVRRCQSSWLKQGGGPEKNHRKKWRAREEERHKGSLTPQKT